MDLFHINILKKLALVPAFLIFLISTARSEVRVAVIDTGFCPESISTKVTINPAIDLTNSNKLNCKKMNLSDLRFHGQQVVLEFLSYLDPKKTKINLFPLIVFDDHGIQKKEYWLRAIHWVKKNNIDIVLTASGFITSEKLVSELPGIWFVPSGRMNPQVKESSQLFPQNLAPKTNLFLIGDYYDGDKILYDQSLLYKERIDYFFPSGGNKFTGTSRAVAEAAAKAINLCSIQNMRACLKKLSKEFTDNISQRKIQTY